MLKKSKPLSKEEFRAVLPRQFKGKLPAAVMDNINHIITGNTAIKEAFRDNLISHTGVLKEGKFTLESYINAVKYVSYKLMGMTNQEAWGKTFPQRMARLISIGATDKEVSCHVSLYNKSKLVNLIYERTLIAPHIYNADIYQMAINEQAKLMLTAKSELVRSNAANSLMVQLKPPETTKIQLDLGAKADIAIDALRETTMKLVEQQRKALENKTVTVEQVAHSPIMDVEYIPVGGKDNEEQDAGVE